MSGSSREGGQCLEMELMQKRVAEASPLLSLTLPSRSSPSHSHAAGTSALVLADKITTTCNSTGWKLAAAAAAGEVNSQEEYMTYPVQGLVIPEVLVRTRSQTALSLLFSTILPVPGMEIHKHINSAPLWAVSIHGRT